MSWSSTYNFDGLVTVVPVNDLVAHEVESEECVCGPKVECIPRENACDAWMVTHQALDGRP